MSLDRLQKILARGGIASRRAAEKLIVEGRVRVNGRVVSELGSKADPRKDRIEIDGKRVIAETFVYVVVHKPRGVVATLSDPEGRPTVRDLLTAIGARVYPVGRLDFATSGVLLATNDGDFSDGLLHPRRAVPKTYVLKVHGLMKPEDLEAWRRGVRLDDGMTLPAEASLIRHEGDKTWFQVTLREGRNQQIRRMGEATGFPVMRLARVSFAGVTTEGLAPGKWRALTRAELSAMKKEYGVPKNIPADTEPEKETGQRRERPREGRPEHPHGNKPRPDAQRDARGGSRNDAPRGETGGPRYGGGSPGRRSYDARDDWSGGANRSTSREGAKDDARPRDGVGGGRSGRSRTTGTSGGVGAREDAGRVKSRRGSRG